MPSTASNQNKSTSSTKSRLKLWIWVPLALFLVIFILLSQIDLESMKEEFVEQVSQQTGLQVEIGSIGFGFSRGIGLQCKGVKVSTPEGNKFSVNQLYLLAEWGPLFQGELKIKSATLVQPEAILEISKPEPKSETDEKDTPSPPKGFVSPDTVQSATAKLDSTPLTIEKLIVSDGKVTLIKSGTSNRLPLNIDGIFIMDRSTKERLDILAQAVRVQSDAIIFEGDGIASNLTANDAGLSLNLKSESFSWSDAQNALNFLGGAIPKSLAPLESTDVEQLLIKAELPLDSLSQIENLKKLLTGRVELKTKNTSLKVGDKRYALTVLNGEGTLEKGILSHNFSGTALDSDFSLKGTLPLVDRDKDSTTHIEWKKLSVEKLPINSESAWRPTQGTLSGKASLTGPMPKEGEKFPGKLKGTVEFQTENLLLTPKDTNEAKPINVGRLNGRGEFDKGQLQHEISGNIWESDFDIKGTLDQNKSTLNTKINWSGLNLAQLPLPPSKGWRPTEGKLSGTLTLNGPTESEKFPGHLKAALKFDAQNIKLLNNDSPNAPPLTFNQLAGNGEFANHQVNYKINGDALNGSFKSDGRVILSASNKSPPVLNNRIEFTGLDLSPFIAPNKGGNLSGTLKLKGPLPKSDKFLTSNLNVDTQFKISNLKWSAGNLPLDIQKLEAKATLKKGHLTHDVNGSLFGGSIKAKGSLNFKKMYMQDLITTDSDLILDHVNLEWVPLIHQSDWAPTSGNVTGNLKIKGPLPFKGIINPAMKLKGTLKAEKLILGNPDKQVGNLKLEFKESSSTLTQAQVELENIKLKDRSFKKVMGLFKITPKKIDLTGGRVWPLNGLVQLIGNFQPNSRDYQLQFKGDKLKVEEFLSPHLNGPLQLSGALKGKLPENGGGMPDHARDLSGNVKIKLDNGALPQLGELENLLTLLNPLSALEANKEGLSYDYLGGDFKIVKGVVHTENLAMKSPQVNLFVKGQANLVEDSVNAQVKAMPLQMLDKTIKAIPLLGQILSGGKKGGVIETHFKVEGKLSKPDFKLQPHKSLLEKPGSILNELINIPKNLGGNK